MNYCSIAEVRKALAPESSFPGGDPSRQPEEATGTAADLNNDQIDDAILEAMSFIDGYIAKFYTTPVEALNDGTMPHPIDFWCRNIAAYNATLTYRGSQDFSDTDPVARRYEATLSALQLVNAGHNTLNIPENLDPEHGSAFGGGPAMNRYEGDLFSAGDFNLGYAYPTERPEIWRSW